MNSRNVIYLRTKRYSVIASPLQLSNSYRFPSSTAAVEFGRRRRTNKRAVTFSHETHDFVVISQVPQFEQVVLTSEGRVNTDYRPVGTSIYAVYFRRWLAYFPRRQIHVIDGDRLVRDPFPEVQKVEAFLGECSGGFQSLTKCMINISLPP